MARKRSSNSEKAVREELDKIPPDRTGLPAPEHVESVESFTAPDNQQYQILKTSETDEYDQPDVKPSRRGRSRPPQ